MNQKADWIIACASVIGSSHIKTNTPCQDSSVIQVSNSGDWVSIVVSDGAGTASNSLEGSSYIAKFFSESLISLSNELSYRPPGHWINDFVIERILNVRENLRKKANSDDISKYHSTLVACLLGPSGGFSIHIGDGAVFGGKAKLNNISGFADLNDSFFISAPDNGEYSNETYFITEGNWIKNLRITPMPNLDWVYVCTDGGTALSMNSENNPKENFVIPVLEAILNEKDTVDRNAVLEKILKDPKANTVTGDDKTIAIACNVNLKNFIGNLGFQSKTPATNNTETISSIKAAQNSAPHPKQLNSLHRKKSWLKPKSRILFLFFTLTLLLLTLIFFLGYQKFGYKFPNLEWPNQTRLDESAIDSPTSTTRKSNTTPKVNDPTSTEKVPPNIKKRDQP